MLRRRVLASHPTCVTPGCGRLATEVDHIVPLYEGGEPWSLENLQSLCKADHTRKTNEEMRRRVY